MTDNTMSEEELDRILTDLRIWSYGVLASRNDGTINQEEFVKQNEKYKNEAKEAINRYTLSKQIEAQRQVLNLLEANLSLAGWGDDISARKLWANVNVFPIDKPNN